MFITITKTKHFLLTHRVKMCIYPNIPIICKKKKKTIEKKETDKNLILNLNTYPLSILAYKMTKPRFQLEKRGLCYLKSGFYSPSFTIFFVSIPFLVRNVKK